MNPQATDKSDKRSGCLAKGLRSGGILLVVFAVLALGGAIYEARAQAAVAARFPAPGQLVEVNGRTMHIHCQGEGSPTIILDAGQGGWSSDWTNIMPELSQNNRVCAYDRAGYGWSDAADDSRSPAYAADDLTALLATAQIQPPYVLVGFSHAGLVDRIFAARHADQMAGLVLIDPATEFDNEIMGADLMRQQQLAVNIFSGFGFMARFGLLRLMGTENMAGSAPFIATETADPELYYTFVAAPHWWETSVQEFASGLDDDHLAMVRRLGPLSDVPLIIIGSDVLNTANDATMEELQSARHDVLRTLAAESSRGEFVIAEGSTHNILVDRPDVVMDAVASIAATPAQ